MDARHEAGNLMALLPFGHDVFKYVTQVMTIAIIRLGQLLERNAET